MHRKKKISMKYFSYNSIKQGIIRNSTKEFLKYIDPSVIDLVADLNLVGTNENINDFENKISNYDEKSESFINYLIESESQYSTLDILSNIDLIPSSSEIEDPISWAARTSLPPI